FSRGYERSRSRSASPTVWPETATSRSPPASSRSGGRRRTTATARSVVAGPGGALSTSCRPVGPAGHRRRDPSRRIMTSRRPGAGMAIEVPKSQWVDLDGPTHYVAWDGPRERTFVLVHGLEGSLLSWLAVGPGLA